MTSTTTSQAVELEPAAEAFAAATADPPYVYDEGEAYARHLRAAGVDVTEIRQEES